MAQGLVVSPSHHLSDGGANTSGVNTSSSVNITTLSLRDSLAGMQLDVLLVPDEDETLWKPDDGVAHIGGMVGEILARVASEGHFTWNAYVVRPPARGDAYGPTAPTTMSPPSRLIPCSAHTAFTRHSVVSSRGDLTDERAALCAFLFRYDGDWDMWMVDWVNRVDLIAIWIFDRASRRMSGISFPYNVPRPASHLT
jgi:hypothetical protein